MTETTESNLSYVHLQKLQDFHADLMLVNAPSLYMVLI